MVLTGVAFDDDHVGCAVSDGKTIEFDFNARLTHCGHGTGDLFASVFAGALLRGKSALRAAEIAADVVCLAIKATPEGHWYGVSFEQAIPALTEMLK